MVQAVAAGILKERTCKSILLSSSLSSLCYCLLLPSIDQSCISLLLPRLAKLPNVIQVGQATWAVWLAIKKYNQLHSMVQAVATGVVKEMNYTLLSLKFSLG